MESAVVRTEPLQGQSGPLTSTVITVLPFSLPWSRRTSWESYSHSLSSLPHLLRTLQAAYCLRQPDETVLAMSHMPSSHSALPRPPLTGPFSSAQHCWPLLNKRFPHWFSQPLSPLPPACLGAPSQPPVFTGYPSSVISSTPEAAACMEKSNVAW